MADGDIYSLLYGDEPTAQEQAAAMSAALRKRQGTSDAMQGLGLLYSHGQNPVTAGLGPALMHASGQQQEAATTGQHQLGQALLGKMQERLKEQQASAEQAYREGELGLRREQQRQGRFTHFVDPATNTVYTEDGKTGAVAPVTAGGQKNLGHGGPGGIKESDWQAFFKQLNPNTGRAGELGKNQARINTAMRALKLVTGPNGEVRDLDKREVPELAMTLQNLLSPGGHSSTEVEHLIPTTFQGDVKGFLERLTNEPQGLGMRAFVEKMKHTVERERDASTEALREAQYGLVPQGLPLHKADKARFENSLRGLGLDPAMLDEETLLRKQAQQSGGTTASISAPTHARDSRYLYNKANGGKTRILKGPDGKTPAPGAKEEENPDFKPPAVASNG